MFNKTFSNSAWVEIQGKYALHFVQRKKEYAEYEVIGYSGQITLKDYREIGRSAIDEVHLTGQVDKFAYQFNAPALVKISDLKSPALTIELYDTQDSDPAHRLWIAIGIMELPVYKYIHKRVVPFEDAFALVALYRRGPNRQKLSSPATFLGV